MALCRAFLRDECRKSAAECELSHDVDPNRTPECGLFLRNLCIDPSCKYLHVKKATDAPVCDDFFNSWCPRGMNCPNRHYLPPASPDKKRRRDETQSEEDGGPSEDEDEDSRLLRIWNEEASLKIYM